MTDKAFIDRIWSIIREVGSQSALAEAIGTSQGTVGGWVNRGSFPSTEHLANLKEKLNININWLITGIGPRYVETPRRDVSGVAEEEAEYEPLSRHDKEYIDKLKTVLTSGNDPVIGMVKASIDAAHGQVESAKKTKAMAG